MSCTACGRASRPGATFCAGCGTKLVAACTACGAELEADARFCDACGAPVGAEAAAPAPPAGDRKVVSILFADLSGSTSMQERLDAEATSTLMAQVHALLRDCVEAHGGSVVKFTGDGVMAVFGVPVLREDDAVRAVKAGIAMQSSFAELALPSDVGLRVGVNTGEVVVAPDTDDVVGDPVNVAARLEAAAGRGEVYVGSETERLVRDAIAVEPVEPLTLKGKREPVRAARVVSVTGTRTASTIPFLGRDDDMASLLRALDDAVATSSTRLVTVVGWPGLGKSRLASELAASVLDRATLVETRFVADGGSSFGPIAVALRQIVDAADLDLGADGERVAATIGALAGGGGAGSTEQVFWAIRRALEALAAQRPVVVVLDDLHWAEPAMLDLVEHLAEWLRGGPVLLLVLARPELRELRPALLDAAGPSASVVVLGGLDADACGRLALEVLGAEELPEGVVRRALDASEGNPLFLRELLRLLVDDGVLCRDEAGRWVLTVEIDAIELPATIHAALAARIEQLQPDERSVLQAASVIGRHFARGAVAALLPRAVADRLDEHLASLHHRALVDPEGTWWEDERLFRFHHVLIRDAAYRRVLKEVRAEQHVRYADWLAARIGDATAEHDEVLGFHLQQALAYRRELGHPIEAELVARAVQHLAAAGRRALDRDDLANAAGLLARALELAPGDRDLLRDRCEALVASGDVHAAAEAVAALTAAADDERSRALADVFDAQLAGQRTPEVLRDVVTRASTAASVLAAHGDDVGVAHAESVHALALAGLGQVAACEGALDRSLAAARRAGDVRRANVVLSIAPGAALWGPSPIARASGRCLDVVRVLRITTWAPHVEAHALRHQAVLEALRERADAARRMLASARATFTDLGHRLGLLETTMYDGLVELLDDDPRAAEEPLRRAVDGFVALGARGRAAQATALLARALLDLDRIDEAEAIADPMLAGDDLKAAIGLLGAAAEVMARRGEVEEAEALARRAVALAEATDALVDHADARLALARVLAAAGRERESAAEREHARSLYEAKGATVGVRRSGGGGGPGAASSPRSTVARPTASANSVSAPGPACDARNLASATTERRVLAIERGDTAAVLAEFTPDVVVRDHVLQAAFGFADLAEAVRAWTASRGAVDATVSLVTLGDRHVLNRILLRWGGDSPGEWARLEVQRTSPDGRIDHFELFAADDVGSAAACLVERWAEDELTGDDRRRGLAMARTFRFATEAINARDWDDYFTIYARDVVVVDHRTAEVTLSGSDAIVDFVRDLSSTGDSFSVRIVDVLRLSPSAVLWQWETSGESDGGGWSMPCWIALRLDHDGLVDRLEFFRPEDLDAALACFDRFSAPRRRVVPNRASDAVDRWCVAADAGDATAAASVYAPGYVVERHDQHVTVDREAWVSTEQRFVGGCSVTVEHLATLGDRHSLSRATVEVDRDGAEVAQDMIWVCRADASGRIVHEDLFGTGDLAPAIACLVGRWADDEVDDAERPRVRALARSWSLGAAYSDAAWDELGELLAPDVVLRVQRTGAADECIGREAVVSYYRTFRERVQRARLETTDVLALSPWRSLLDVRVVGEVDGAPFELASLAAVACADDGRIARLELFDPDDLDVAWERFDAEEVPPRRRVVPNRATATTDQFAPAMQARDGAALAALFADEFEVCEGRGLPTVPGAAFVEALRGMLDAGVVWEIEHLVTLGERHVLSLLAIRWPATDDRGELDRPRYCVSRVDRAGRFSRMELFDDDELGYALGCLVECHAEGELDHAGREQAARIAHVWEAHVAKRAGDWEPFGERFAATAVVEDHRPNGVTARGRDEVVAWYQSLLAVTERSSVRTVDVYAVALDGSMVEIAVDGMHDGGSFGFRTINVITLDAAGRIARIDMFAPEDLEAAWACFDARAARRPQRRVDENRASRLVDVWTAAVRDGDLERARALRAPEYEHVDHELQLVLGRDEQAHREGALVPLAFEDELLATLGTFHSLHRLHVVHRRDTSGTVEFDVVMVNRTDERDLVVSTDVFDARHLDRALTCLAERWAESELDGDDRARAMQLAQFWSFPATVAARDWDRYRSMLASEVVQVDHRPTGAGELRGAAAGTAWIRELSEAVDELRIEVSDVLALTARATLWHNTVTGASRGGPFLIPSLVAARFDGDGRTARTEFFPLDAAEEAWACFEAMDAPAAARRVAPNLASAARDRWAAAMRAGDVDAVMATKRSDYVMVHHGLQSTIDREDHRARLDGLGPAVVGQEVLATLGMRHSLHRVQLAWPEPPGGGAVAFELLGVCRVDDDGLVVREDNFEVEQLSRAAACLVERWAEDELDGPARARALASAGSFLHDEYINAKDWDGERASWDDRAVLVDHRTTGLEIRGPEALTAWVRELAGSADRLEGHLAEVLALTPQATLWRWLSSGEVNGGHFSMPTYIVGRVGPSGPFDRMEFFREEDLDDAWACFEQFDQCAVAVDAMPPAAARRVASNAATAAVARWAAAANAGDGDAAASRYAPGYVLVRHDQHLEEDRETWLRTEEALVGRAAVVAEPVAALGERHALSRVSTEWASDGSVVRIEGLYVNRVDVDGRTVLNDLFPSEALADAMACLVERWAEDELADDPVLQARAAAIADACRLTQITSDGDWASFGRLFTADCIQVDHRPVSIGALRGADEIVRWTRSFRGSVDTMRVELVDVLALTPDAALLAGRVSGTAEGAPYETEPLQLVRFGPTGRVYLVEYFSRDQLDDAWRRFDVREPEPRSAVRPNLAWAAIELRSRAEAADVRHVATLGDRHALYRLGCAPDGDFVLARTDAEGLVVDEEVLHGGGLATAVRRLVASWVEHERASAPPPIARCDFFAFFEAVNEERWDHVRAMYADHATHVDHRAASVGTIAGADAIVEWMSSYPADELRVEVSDVLAVDHDAALVRMRAHGHADGATFDFASLVGARIGDDGLVTASVQFAPEQLAEAWSWLDERGTTLAVRTVRSWCDALRRRDLEASISHYRDDIVLDEMRSIVSGSYSGIESASETTQYVLESGLRGVTATVVACPLDRIALVELHFALAGWAEIVALAVVVVDKVGRIARITMFDPGAMDQARAHLVYEGGALAHNDRDIGRFRAWFTEDAVVENHKPAGFGVTDADGFASLSESLWSLHRAEVHGNVERAAPGIALVHSLTDGPDNDGGRMQISSWVVIRFGDDGRVSRLDTWDEEERAAAEAWYERATAARLWNRACASLRRWVDAVRAGDADAIAALYASDVVTIDRRPLLRAEHVGSAAPVANDLEIARTGGGFLDGTVEILDVVGDDLALLHLATRHRDGSEFDVLVVSAVDESGAVVWRVVFEGSDLDAARAELEARARQQNSVGGRAGGR